MNTVARRDFRSIPYRDASETWTAIVDLLTSGSDDPSKRQELLKVAGVACSIIADQGPRESPIVVTCDGPRTRIYCSYDDDALDDSSCNEAKLGFDALKGHWQVSLPVDAEELTWVQAALKKNSSRVVARDKDLGIEIEEKAEATAGYSSSLNIEGFMKL